MKRYIDSDVKHGLDIIPGGLNMRMHH